MTKHPEKILTFSDIPPRVDGAARYTISSQVRTGGYDVIMFDTEAKRSFVVERKGTQQAALRAAIRWQRKENAAVRAAAREGAI